MDALHKVTEAEIVETCMLVSLRVSQWTGRKKDKAVSDTATQAYHASVDAGAFHKALLPDLERVQKEVGKARATYYHLTLPWMDDGQRVVSVKLYDKLMQRLREHKLAFEAEVVSITADYHNRVNAQQARLGSMFRMSDYPSLPEFMSRFGFRWYVQPLPKSDDCRLRVSECERDRIKSELKAQVEQGIRESVRDAWARLRDVVDHAATKLSEPGAIFRDSLIENIEGLLEVLPGLNLTGDSELDRLAEETRKLFAGVLPDSLRTRKGERERVRVAGLARVIVDQIDSAVNSPDVQMSEEATARLREVTQASDKFAF